MKRIIIALTLLVFLSLGSVFASGSQEEELTPRSETWEDNRGELIELTGIVDFPGYGHLELVADGETYELMVPFFLLDEVDIEDGETVTVKGFLVPGPRWGEDDDEKHLAVTEATVDGEEYELGFARGYMRGRMADNRFGGRGKGPQGNYPDCDPGYGPGTGPRQGYAPRGQRGGYGHMGPGGGSRGGRW